jgi:hypothetical protein
MKDHSTPQHLQKKSQDQNALCMFLDAMFKIKLLRMTTMQHRPWQHTICKLLNEHVL